tara:strand:- start:202 stop:789 length:588 start_codon:yes stop_codon:yes gene_type:complete
MSIVSINVGGILYKTSNDTLTSQQSMLSAMFGGRYQPGQTIDGHTFIDRDGHTFRWILNWLRGVEVLPKSDTDTFALLYEEATYYGLDTLIKRMEHIKSPRFAHGTHVSVRNNKYTIVEPTVHGYTCTKLGKKYQLKADEHVQIAYFKVHDKVMAYNKQKSKYTPAQITKLFGQQAHVQFEHNDNIHMDLKWIKF